MDTIFWSRNAYGKTPFPPCKSHFTNDHGRTTLCGRTVPSKEDAIVDSLKTGEYVGCKACQKTKDQDRRNWLTEKLGD